MTHAGYIAAAYLATAIVLFGMVAWVVLDLRAQKRKVRQLEGDLARRPEALR